MKRTIIGVSDSKNRKIEAHELMMESLSNSRSIPNEGRPFFYLVSEEIRGVSKTWTSNGVKAEHLKAYIEKKILGNTLNFTDLGWLKYLLFCLREGIRPVIPANEEEESAPIDQKVRNLLTNFNFGNKKVEETEIL